MDDVSPALQAIDLYRFFHAGDHETLALRGVNVSVETGQVVAVTGPSGSGKSTLLACLAGLDEPDGGMVIAAGHPLSRRPEAERSAMRARHIGILFQHGNLLETLTVMENVRLAQLLSRQRASRSASRILDELGIAHRSQARPSNLSGGEAARAGLAVAIANDPEIILADEPTGELDSTTAQQVMGVLRERADRGAAVLIVTHTPEIAAAADAEIRLVDGKVLAP